MVPLREQGPHGTTPYLVEDGRKSPVPGVKFANIRYQMGDQRFTNVLLVQAPRELVKAEIVVDPSFARDGIVFEREGGRLIDQERTSREKRGGGMVGRMPEVVAREASEAKGGDPVLAVAINHFGWMRGEIVKRGGEFDILANEQDNLTERIPMMGLTEEGWRTATAYFENGQIQNPEAVRGMRLGYSVVQLLRDGTPVPLAENAGVPRVKGDIRNFLNFQDGVPNMPGTLRKILPDTEDTISRLFTGQRVLVYSNDLTAERVAELNRAIRGEGSKVSELMAFDYSKDTGQASLEIFGQLPLNRIPATVSGYNNAGDFVAMIVNGRQADSVGGNYDELTEMAHDWMHEAAFGPAGGDASAVGNDGTVYNNVQTRPHPSHMILSGQKVVSSASSRSVTHDILVY